MAFPTIGVDKKIIIFVVLGVFLLIGLFAWAVLPNKEVEKPKCGYSTCPITYPRPKINIHLVPHSHDELGWLYITYDQMYDGYVQYIIDSVITSLLKNPGRRFAFAEMAHLWRWWKSRNDTMRETLRKLVDEGRFEIVGGGWSMNDEAVTHYQSIIDQQTWGLRRINDTFGTCGRPRVGWQIDTFGHSREQVSILARMGFDGMFVGRMDYVYKWARLWNRTAEFIWKGSDSLGKSANLFTSILYNRFSPPPGFCFDVFCGERVPIIDDPENINYNVDDRAGKFLGFALNQAFLYKTNNILITMGDTNFYQNAELWYANMDKLIKHINHKGSDFNVFYSTPSCYMKALHDLGLTWPVKIGDMFPYSFDRHTFWTGFYTSRPALKYFERLGNNFLQVTKQLSVMANLSDSEELENFREAMGVLQHHEAVTGTAQQNVADDYAKLLYRSIAKGQSVASRALNKWALRESIPNPPEFHSCLLLNISSCDYSSDHRQFVVTVYNPTSQLLTTFIRVPVQKLAYGVKDYTGNDIVIQMVPIPEAVQQIPGRISSASMELIFLAENISPLGFQSFYVYQKKNVDVKPNDLPNNTSQLIGGELFNVSANARGGILINMTKGASGLKIRQSFQYYEAAEGNNAVITNRSSGAYVFRPKSNVPKVLNVTNSTQIFKGPLVEELHQVVNDWVSQVVRIYKGKSHVEFDWLIGPVPVDPSQNLGGKEVITKYISNLRNSGTFYTDSNGREMIKRRINRRPHIRVWLNERVAGNYYPITTKIAIEDRKRMFRMSVLNDRPQGGSSLISGQIQLMLHRRLSNHDDVYVGEVLNEYAYGSGLVVRGKHYLIAGNLMDNDDLILQEKEGAIELAQRPWVFFTPTTSSFQEWNQLYKMKGDGLMKSLPRNVRILTLEPWKDGEILLRLEHIFEESETSMYSTVAQVDFKELFSSFTVESIQELTLGANQFLKDEQRLKWTSEGDDGVRAGDPDVDKIRVSSDSIIVQLKCMQIRTFVVKLKHGLNS